MSAKQVFKDKVLLKSGTDITEVYEYTSAKQTAIVGCRQGHRWQLIPSNLLSRGNGSTCPICSNNNKYCVVDGVAVFVKTKTSSTFSEELAKINTEAELVDEYSGAHVPVTLSCKKCKHTWSAIPTNILTRGTDAFCSVCVDKHAKYKTTLEGACAKIHNVYPDLTVLEYNGSGKECVVKDSACGHTYTSWYSNLAQAKGYRCPICVPDYGRSKNEVAIGDYISKVYSGWVEFNDRSLIKPKELDIVLPELGLAIEYNSAYTHEDKDHLYKTTAVEGLGFRLIQINEDEWKTKTDIVKSRLLSVLGGTYSLGARECKVCKIGFPADFLDANHIQGRGGPTSINYGLFLQEELVAVMTFRTPRFDNTCDYELIRYCSLTGVTVTGGAGKLLKAFLREYPGVSVLSYSDRRWSTGGLYKSLGFSYSHSSPPGYAYYKNNIKLSRFQCQKHMLQDKFPDVFDPKLSEHEIMKLAGFNRMYDCGTDVWILNNKSI